MSEETYSSPANQANNIPAQSGEIAPSITAVGVVQMMASNGMNGRKEVAHGGTGLHIPASNGNSGSRNSLRGLIDV